MSNIKNYYFDNLKIRLNNSEYWDLFITSDQTGYDGSTLYCESVMTGTNLTILIDFNDPNSYLNNVVKSLVSWEGAEIVSSGISICDYGITQIDVLNVTGLTGDTLIIMSSDTAFSATAVSGLTYLYGFDTQSATTIGNYINLYGGFFQGFWKLQGYEYQVVPNKFLQGWSTEFWINHTPTADTTNTVNDLYPDNKGFIFYMGVRSENKFWNLFSGETGYTTCDGIYTISPSGNTIDPGDSINPFLKWNSCYQQVCVENCSSGSSISGDCRCVYESDYPCASNCKCDCTSLSAYTVYDKPHREDIIDNNIGIRIKDDGSIGYRFLTYSAECSGNTTINTFIVNEGYSVSGTVKSDTWEHVTIVFKRYFKIPVDDCDKFYENRKGKLMFFVNGYLKYIVHNFDEILFKGIDEIKEKSVGVAFNMSIGGGTIGLLETQTFNGPDIEDSGLDIETFFAGTFMGGISKFRFYNKPLDVTEIRCNYNSEKNVYK